MSPKRRVAVLSGRSPLAQGVIDRLGRDAQVESVRGLAARPARDSEADLDVDVVPIAPDHRGFAEYLAKERVDTVIQCGLVPDRDGDRARGGEADVIATMCAGAAIGSQDSPVRSWVVVSSSDVYPIESHAPLLQDERAVLRPESEGVAASILEAEDYARDLARRLPYVSVAILRLQQIVGPEARGPLARLLGRGPTPVPIGFDPAIQLLHLDDATGALAFAALRELAGVYNVASAGSLRWHQAIRATGHGSMPVLPLSASLLEPVLERLGVPFVPAELSLLLRYGHVIDTAKLERRGWHAEHDQRDCLAELRAR